MRSTAILAACLMASCASLEPKPEPPKEPGVRDGKKEEKSECGAVTKWSSS